MAGDWLVLLVPPVEGVEVELHVTGEVVVREPESGGGPVTDRNGVAGGRVDGEWDPRVQQARDVVCLRCGRRQLRADVLDWHGV